MARGQLTREQNVKSASIFLNNFGLTLEEKQGLKNNSKLNILDCFGDPVGELVLDGEYIRIKTLSPFGILTAQYKRSFYNVGFDIINGGVEYCDWSSNINFDIFKSRGEKYRGTFSVEASIDENGKRSVDTQSVLKFMVDDEDMIILSLMNFGDSNFVMSISDEVGYEEICYHSNRLAHKRSTEDGGKIDTFVHEEDGLIVVESDISQDGNRVFSGDIASEVARSNDLDKKKQMIKMISDNDPALKHKVQDVKRVFVSGDCDLFSNFVSACVDQNDSENVYELLGMSRRIVHYQNGSDNLRDAYFGKDNSEFALAPKMRRKLKKKI